MLFVTLPTKFAGLVYRYYAAFPRLRGGFDSRIPLQKSLKSTWVWEIFFFA